MPGVARNTATLLVASVLQKVIAFAYFAVIARLAGVEDTGRYFFALSWTLLFTTVTDLGLTPVLIRESAKDPSKTGRYLGQVLALKLPLMVLAGLIATGGGFLISDAPATRLMVALASIVIILDAFSLTFYGVLRGHHRLAYEGIGLIIGQSITLAIGGAVLFFGLPMPLLVLALVAGSAYNAVASWWIVRTKLGIWVQLSWDKPFIKELVRTALPFALAGAFVKIYTNADAVLLTRLKGEAAAGLYAVPYKLTFAFQFVPMAFTAALYPAMSRAWATDRARLGVTLEKGLRYLALLSAPIAAGIMALAPEIVGFVYGVDYLPAAPALMILIPTLLFVFLDFPIGSLLNATDRQATQTKLMGFAMLVSVALNLALIPAYGISGVAIASLVSHAVLFFTGIAAIGKFLEWPVGTFAADGLRIMMAAVGMGSVVYFAKSHVPLVASIALGGLAYPALILLLRVSSIGEARQVIGTILKRRA